MSQSLTILQGDALEKLRELPSESVHCCVTSPPYWGLRDYGTAEWEGGELDCDHVEKSTRGDSGRPTCSPRPCYDGKPNETFQQFARDCGKCGAKRIDAQLGLEKTPHEYVAKMVEIFREVRRVLRKDGTLWLNLGDSYNNVGGGTAFNEPEGSLLAHRNEAHKGGQAAKKWVKNLKPKDLCGIPWRLAFALQADGWYLRSDIIWSKPNPMPESVTDRPTKAHEYLFLLTKSPRYFYDAEAIKEKAEESSGGWQSRARNGLETQSAATIKCDDRNDGGACIGPNRAGSSRNKRSVWTVATAPYPEAHFAVYPPDLIKPCIMAGTSARGCCAKCGAPWERVVESEREATRSGRFSATDHTAPHFQAKGSGGNTELRYRYETTTKTLGWQPGCECNLSGGRSQKKSSIEDGAPTVEASVTAMPAQALPRIPCTVLDPFAGSGTTGAVALELGRKAVLIELNPKYVGLIEERCNVTLGLALA
jgi:DNA modification methylase